MTFPTTALVRHPKGGILIATIVFTTIFVFIAGGLLSLIQQQQRLASQRQSLGLALQIAEAGANYYRWHLAHAPEDYEDGNGPTGCKPCGPYQHEFRDPAGDLIGYFELVITPPDPTFPGSTIVKILSTAWTLQHPNSKRRVAVSVGRPSLARFTTIVHNNISYGSTSETFGPVHSNGGVKFDGTAHNLVTSAMEEYWISGGWEDGVWTSQPDENEVFLAGKEFPVSPVDFGGFTQNLNTMETHAQDDGAWLGSSGFAGYHVQLQNDDTFSWRVVQTTTASCNGETTGGISSYNGSWTTEALPENGLIFVKDNVWIDGQIDGSRVTVVAAKDPLDTGTADIFLNNDLLYTSKEGEDVIGLIAQRNVVIGLYSEDDLEIDAILIAKNGRRYRPDYDSVFDCGPTALRTKFTLYGSTISYLTPFMFSGSSGYQNRSYIYDPNTLFSPPPFFPTTGEYIFVSWEEVIQDEIY